MKEIYGGAYFCDTHGNVTSKQRNGTQKGNKMLKWGVSKVGYCSVTLQLNGLKKRFLVHRLVAQAFIPNPENKPCVNHINGIKTDNRVENLEWVTNSENEIHAHKTGLKDFKKDNNPARKISSKIAVEIRGMKGVYSQQKIGEKYGICQSNVSRILNSKTW